MINLTLLSVLLIPILLIAGLIYLYKKLPRSYFILSIFIFVAVITIGDYLFDKKTLTDNIPASLAIKKSISINYNIKIDYDCGLGIFELNEETTKIINNEGIIFLNTSLTPRRHDRNDEYQQWNKTPVPKNWDNSEGGVFPAWCNNANKELLDKITLAVKESGGFYTHGGYAGGYTLYVLPKLGILIVSVFIM